MRCVSVPCSLKRRYTRQLLDEFDAPEDHAGFVAWDQGLGGRAVINKVQGT